MPRRPNETVQNMTRCCRDCRGALQICANKKCACHNIPWHPIEDKSRLTAYSDPTGNRASARADRTRRNR